MSDGRATPRQLLDALQTIVEALAQRIDALERCVIQGMHDESRKWTRPNVPLINIKSSKNLEHVGPVREDCWKRQIDAGELPDYRCVCPDCTAAREAQPKQ